MKHKEGQQIMQNNIYKEDIRLLRKVKSENRLIMFVEVNISKKII